MVKQMIYLLGSSYSGSSLLTTLWDAQPGCRGLQETQNYFKPNQWAHCSACRTVITQCQSYQRWQQQQAANIPFAYFMQQEYPDTDVFFHSTKFLDSSFQTVPSPPPAFALGLVLLYKHPHAFAYSNWRHQQTYMAKPREFGASLLEWCAFYEHLLAGVNYMTQWSTQYKASPCKFPLPRIASDRVAIVNYHQLVQHPPEAMMLLGEQFGLMFNLEATSRPWEFSKTPRTCGLGGNEAIYAQNSGNQQFFAEQAAKYLGGKYQQRYHKIFVDDYWQQDEDFKAVCRYYYQQYPLAARINSLLEQLQDKERVSDFLFKLTAVKTSVVVPKVAEPSQPVLASPTAFPVDQMLGWPVPVAAYTQLPQQLAMPPESVCTDGYHLFWYRHLRQYALEAGLTVTTHDRPPLTAYATWELLLDGCPLLFNFADKLVIPGILNRYPLLLAVQALSMHEENGLIDSYPSCGYASYAAAQQARKQWANRQTATIINARMSLCPKDNRQKLKERRRQVHALLKSAFVNQAQVLTDFIAQPQFLAELAACSVLVHVGGTFNRSWDRTNAQAFNQGACVISPLIDTVVGEQRPVAGTHYLCCRDDYADLVEVVTAALQDREKCKQVGAAAMAFFDRNCSPANIWGRIHARVHYRRTDKWLYAPTT